MLNLHRVPAADMVTLELMQSLDLMEPAEAKLVVGIESQLTGMARCSS